MSATGVGDYRSPARGAQTSVYNTDIWHACDDVATVDTASCHRQMRLQPGDDSHITVHEDVHSKEMVSKTFSFTTSARLHVQG